MSNDCDGNVLLMAIAGYQSVAREKEDKRRQPSSSFGNGRNKQECLHCTARGSHIVQSFSLGFVTLSIAGAMAGAMAIYYCMYLYVPV